MRAEPRWFIRASVLMWSPSRPEAQGRSPEHSAAVEVRLAAFPFAGGAEGLLSQRSVESGMLTEASSIVMRVLLWSRPEVWLAAAHPVMGEQGGGLYHWFWIYFWVGLENRPLAGKMTRSAIRSS